jgi:RNA polymerase sigma-70 factor (ECF subfamily)
VLALKVIPRQADSAVDENRIIERVLAGDSEAYGHFVRSYQRRVFGLCLRLLRDRGEAECVAQEAFLKAYQALGEFRGGSSFETWVTRIALNGCRDRLKRKRLVLYFHQAPPSEDEDREPHDSVAGSDPSPERRLLSREIRRRLVQALDELSAQQKMVFSLKHFDGRSIPEIAHLMGIDSGTVKSHLFRASGKIRKRLQDLRRAL